MAADIVGGAVISHRAALPGHDVAFAKGVGPASRPSLLHPQRCFRPYGVRRRVEVYSRALDITDTEEQQNYLQALFQRIGDQPVGHEFHCFAMDIKSAAVNTLIGEEFEHQVWKTR